MRWLDKRGRKPSYNLLFALAVILLALAACGDGAESTAATAEESPAQSATNVVTATQPAGTASLTAGVGLLHDAEWGQSLYTMNCAPCHQLNGEGKLYRFPALNGNALVVARQPQPLIQTVLYGRGGVMPGFAPTLSDREIAAVLSYIRNAWSNSASMIETDQVSQVKTTTTPTPAVTGEEMGQSSY
jgi:cytochrome c6